MRSVVALFFALGLILPFFPRLAPAAVELEAARRLFEAKCSGCHPLDRSLKKSKDRAGWEKTVIRMKGYAPGQISDAEAATIVEYLVRVRGRKN